MSRSHRATAYPLAALLLSAVAACAPSSTDTASAETTPGDARPPSQGVAGGREAERETLVVVEPLSLGSIRDEIVVSAKVESRMTVSVFPKLSSLPIMEVLVEEGQPVRAGDVLMRLFDVDLQLSANTAAASLEEARKEVERQELSLEEEDARITRAERQAQKNAADLARLEGLVTDGLVNQQEVDDARLLSEQASDDLAAAGLARQGAKIALELSEIRLKKALVDSERAASDLSYTTVRAPSNGIVSQRNVEVGELSSLSAPAFQVVDVSQPILNLRVPQDALARLEGGQRVEVRSITNVDMRFSGVVRTVNPVLDQTTGTVHVIVDLVSVPGLLPGLFCEARIITGERADALLVNKRAVMYDDDRPYFYVMSDDLQSVRKVLFDDGASTATSIEVVASLDDFALDTDMRVVLVGQESLKDGARVRVREEAY